MTLPPMHPILVNFSAALVPISFVSDLLGRVLRRPSLTATGWWTLLYAVLITPFTVLAGWYWLKQMSDMDHSEMGIHKWLGTALAVVLPVLLWARWRSYKQGITPGWVYIVCAGLVVAVLTLQGHLGGMMSFGSDAPADATEMSKKPVSPMNGMQHGGAGPNPTLMPVEKQLQWKDHIDVAN